MTETADIHAERLAHVREVVFAQAKPALEMLRVSGTVPDAVRQATQNFIKLAIEQAVTQDPALELPIRRSLRDLERHVGWASPGVAGLIVNERVTNYARAMRALAREAAGLPEVTVQCGAAAGLEVSPLVSEGVHRLTPRQRELMLGFLTSWGGDDVDIALMADYWTTPLGMAADARDRLNGVKGGTAEERVAKQTQRLKEMYPRESEENLEFAMYFYRLEAATEVLVRALEMSATHDRHEGVNDISRQQVKPAVAALSKVLQDMQIDPAAIPYVIHELREGMATARPPAARSAER